MLANVFKAPRVTSSLSCLSTAGSLVWTSKMMFELGNMRPRINWASVASGLATARAVGRGDDAGGDGACAEKGDSRKSPTTMLRNRLCRNVIHQRGTARYPSA